MLKFLLVKVGNKDSYSGLDKTRQWPAYPDSPGSITLSNKAALGELLCLVPLMARLPYFRIKAGV